MTRFTFTVYMSGTGKDQDEAWKDAIEAFQHDPGDTPMTYREEEEETDKE